MKDLDVTVKNHPLATGMIIALLCSLLGAAAGWLFAFEATQSIAQGVRANNPHDPLDMLPFVQSMYIGLGFCGGAIVGLFAGSVVYFANRQRGSQHLNSPVSDQS